MTNFEEEEYIDSLLVYNGELTQRGLEEYYNEYSIKDLDGNEVIIKEAK